MKTLKKILTLTLLTLASCIGIGVSIYAAIGDISWPSSPPLGPGEQTGGLFQGYATKLFQNCTDGIMNGYSGATINDKIQNCIDFTTLRTLLLSGITVSDSDIMNKGCPGTNNFIVGFSSSGQQICKIID